jgi:glutamate dehydrogenase/leucine dehydrogenase
MQVELRMDGDDLGPRMVVGLRDVRAGLEAVVVVDDTACGPAIGGVRMASDVSAGEVARLARAMTLKNAAAGLPHGGAKAGIVADPRMDPAAKQALVRAFARAMRTLTDYIPGPDMGTDETCMAWVRDEIGRAVGLPRVVGGIPLDEIGATGYGLAVAAEEAAPFAGIELEGARVAVQGFGAVGRHAALRLRERGAVLVAAADSAGTIHHPGGLDAAALAAHKASGGKVGAFGVGEALERDAILGVECDIWIPAARPDVIREENADQLKTRLILQGANIAVTAGAEAALHERGVVSVPDFIANAGGVICAAVEYAGGREPDAFATIADRIRRNTREVLERSRDTGTTPRQAAVEMAFERVREARSYRRR